MDEVFLVRKEVELMNIRLKAIVFALYTLCFFGAFAPAIAIAFIYFMGKQ